jgi:predicted ATPase
MRTDRVRLDALFQELVDAAPTERAAAIRARCGDDPELQQQLESLLSAHDHVSTIFGRADSGDERDDHAAATAEWTAPPRHRRYQVTREIGRGGMGIVYLATDRDLDRPVALKLLSSRHAASAERLLAEARAAAMVDHPNVATVYDVGHTEDGRLFMAMAYCAGESLRSRLERGPLPVADASSIASQIAEGLAAAHGRGLVHRDIKPANVLFAGPGLVRIVDFGIADRTDPGRTRSNEIVGTMAYMSPEQARGDRVDARTDLWSLGIVLVEMLTGRRPFAADAPLRLLYAILHEPAPPLPADVRRRAPGLQRVVERLLEKDPDQRYRTAEELLVALQTATSPPDAVVAPLPLYLTGFVGRERDRAAARHALQTGRLVTLTGAPGTGKTRLAVRLASEVGEAFPHGTGFVALGAIEDPQLVPSAIAQALGIRGTGTTPLTDAIKQRIADRQVLLVLDNFEQVLPAGPFVADLVASCPGLTVLVTSRASLRVSGEREFPVMPLACPDGREPASPTSVAGNDAVALFVQRATALQPAFALDDVTAPIVAEICRRLDGLPLAIELAAARVKVLSPAGILQRLERRLDLLKGGARDSPSRHQALREAIGWSYGLLAPGEKQLLRRLAVFAGGFTLEAAERVAAAAGEVDVLDGLTSLVENNLLQRDPALDADARYRMLETIREFSLECLRASGAEAPARRAHLEHVLSVVERVTPRLDGPQQGGGLDELERDHDNLRAAFEWAIGSDDADAAAQLAAGLWRFWLMRGHLREGRDRLSRVLAVLPPSAPQRLPLLAAAGSLAQNMGEYVEARAWHQQAVDLARVTGDQPGVARALNDLGWVAWRQGDYEAARALSHESLALHRQLGDEGGVAHALNNLGWVAHHQGDYVGAEAFHRQSLSLREARGDARAIGFSLVNLGWALVRQGELQAAGPLVTRARALLDRVGERQLFAFAGVVLAMHEHAAGRPEEALAILATSEETFRRIGDRYGVAAALCGAAAARADLGDTGAAERDAAESLALRRDIGDRWGEAESLALQARLADTVGRREDARRLWRDAQVAWSRLGDEVSAAACVAGLSTLGPEGSP